MFLIARPPRHVAPGHVEVSYVAEGDYLRSCVMATAKADALVARGARVTRLRHADGRMERPQHRSPLTPG
ncbi:hypothetical protein [Cellulomonas dongxiuzhuiae]|uniref:hypothetical protein n=1 Tax=Cellulomonas dongxiuzhuiae TaxID=2819979 RepID=UPI001AAFDBB9|nr:hypothetical protein [Cellulomonas dongxiuzhuiae]MBO3095854.1 hypothetical protein [Cellulomonas dongxiuzhuiae]